MILKKKTMLLIVFDGGCTMISKICKTLCCSDLQSSSRCCNPTWRITVATCSRVELVNQCSTAKNMWKKHELSWFGLPIHGFSDIPMLIGLYNLVQIMNRQGFWTQVRLEQQQKFVGPTHVNLSGLAMPSTFNYSHVIVPFLSSSFV